MKYARRSLIVAGVIFHIDLTAEESFYNRVRSLTTINDTGPQPTDPLLKDERLLDSGEVAGISIGMSMSEVVEKWGKPKVFYSSCMG